MRREILHICAATLTFATGFLVSASDGSFILALVLAVFFFTLVKTIISPNPDLHYVKVVVLTLLIWIPFVKAINYILPFPSQMSCEIYGPEVTQTGNATTEQKTISFNQPVNDVTDSYAPDCSCSGKRVNPSFYNSIWVGVINAKAISMPQPAYPPGLKSANVRGTVAVSVLVDEEGKVVWAESLSGHPLLRQAARDAACRARFTPTFVDGPLLRVSGILTYRFGL